MGRTLYDNENVQNEERRKKIIDYVKKNSGTTKTDVIKYMNENGSSIMTTHRLISKLESKKLLLVQKDKPNSQIHHLILNDKSSYNRIDNTLSDIEAGIDLVDKAGSDLRKQRTKLSAKFSNAFFTSHHKYNLMMLLGFLEITNKKIHSENYFKSLHNRIIGLIIRLNKQVGWNEGNQFEFEHVISYLENFFDEEGVERDPSYIRLVNNLRTTIENSKNILSEMNV